MALAVSISPMNSIASQPARFWTMLGKLVCRYGDSNASIPPNFWTSSVASSWTTSTMSSMVTMPCMRPASSTTGMAMKP